MSEKTIFIFPGQGSQQVGMNKKLGELSSRQKELFEAADVLLGFSLSELIENGPETELAKTSNTQPALLTIEIAAVYALEERGILPQAAMGHSLGEYAALVCAGTLDFESGVKIVRARGSLMEKAVEKTPGKMAAVIGAEGDKYERLKEIVAENSKNGVLEIVNYNSPSQAVISGEEALIIKAVEQIRAEGVGKTIILNVSAPFHSSLMKPIAEEFGELLKGFEFRPPKIGFVDNVTGGFEEDPEKIRKKLVLQLYSPVLWTTCLNTALESGFNSFIECGPGSVLAGLAKRSLKEVRISGAEKIIAS